MPDGAPKTLKHGDAQKINGKGRGSLLIVQTGADLIRLGISIDGGGMGIFDFLFGAKTTEPAVGTRITSVMAARTKVVMRKNFMCIDDIGFYGSCATSPSGEWAIACHDGSPDGSRTGRYVLYNVGEQKIYVKASMERPNSGHVADNGTFSLEDWLFGGDLNGTFYVFDKFGNLKIKRRFEANILNSAISNNGMLAICQTANSKTEDGNILAGFDLTTGVELFAVHPSTFWADEYSHIPANIISDLSAIVI